MKYIISALALVSAFVLKAQTISGEVFDQVNREVLVGAAVQVLGQDEGTITNEQGEYQLTGLMPGRYSLRITYVGYQSMVVTDVWVKAGKVTVQNVGLKQDLTLDEVTVYEDVMLTEPGRIYITEEQINRFAATYYDPARLATSSPDVAVANDQNNQVSVRGISPAYNTWRLEGAEIVNPNHLSNAGTFTDQPTATGGGVNMLSAQMLDRSVFLYSTFDNQYTNSVGGIFDMRLKNGNKLDRQYTAQASLIGFDLATEGPFKKGGRATYSANYRYSFTGLLTSFGVDFGGESIGFQDLAVNLAFPVGKRSELKVFAVGGLSFNNFEHKPYDESEVAKDRSDIYYDNKTGAIGLNLINGFKQGKLSTTVALSGYENERHQNGYNDDDELIRETLFHSDETIFSFHSGWERRLSMFRLQLGGLLNYYTRHVTDVAVNQYLAQPYVQLSGPLGNHLTTSIGLTYYQTEDDQSWDPRGSVTYSFSRFHSFSLGSGIYSQLLNPYNFAFSNSYGNVYLMDNYSLITSWRNTLSYQYERSGFNLGAELFYYDFSDVNMRDELWTEVVISPEPAEVNEESAETYGLTISSERSYRNGFYYRLGGSLFTSDISGEIKNQYNSKYNLSLATGKEWDVSKGGKERALSVNGRVLYQGGQNYSRYMLMSSPDVIETNISPYRTAPYFRFDLRVQWTLYRGDRTSSIALDLQNAIGYENEAYKYYDSFTEKVETQYQLGLIPILAYRLEW